ncbi:MAG: 1-acyl-sn-glycerol-3-phosphate acyltransferase [Caldilineales bacterium]|nr:1-acyl-sn-glycerol-3-phosphate acyltransferase [Caldilineales bacterium]
MSTHISDLGPYPATGSLTFSQRFTRFIASLFGWRIALDQSPPLHCVIIGAPHTTNWDFIALLFLKFGTGLPFRWVGKDNAFRGPLDRMFRKLGGIPVNRRERTNFVQQMVNSFKEEESLMLIIAPEGTRQAASNWRTGFYYIALGARAPIVLGYVDYRTKTVGLGPSLMPTGNPAVDFREIADFYKTITPKHLDNVTVLQIPDFDPQP